ncbi:MAG TPA: RidA family protein [Egicoccus sp.]|nr:RidA family protein [Egicoccus sp.]HSK24678.1 RidA family protein [Egicoccus sp.]
MRRVDPPEVFDTRRYGFSQAVVVEAGRRVVLSGQVAVDVHDRTVGRTLREQLEQSVENIRLVLGAAGAGLGDVVMLRIYVVEAAADDLSPVSEMLLETFPDRPPATTWITVAGLARPDWLVELEAEAALE